MNWKKAVWFLSLSAAVTGCGLGTDNKDDVRENRQNLTAEQNRVLGFEAPTQDWSASNGSAIAASGVVTQGAASLSVQPNGYTEIVSIALSAPGAARDTATLDIQLPQVLSWGDARLVAQIPSAGQHWRDLGGTQLAGRAAGMFHSLSFPIPADLRAALNGSATDVSFRIILNVPAGSGAFLLDNLVVADGASTPDGGATTVTEQFSIVVPQGTTVADQMISATDKVTIDDRSTLAEQDSFGNVANLGPGRIELGAEVDVYSNVYSVGDVDFLRSQSTVYGSIVTAGTVQQQDNVTVLGGITTGATITPATTQWSVDWPVDATNDISLSPDTPNVNVAPGAYDSITVASRATFTLQTGAYFINSLVVEPQAHFRIDASAGPVLIYVKDTLRLNVGLEYVGGERGQVLFGYLGNQAALFQEALVASVVAPQSAIELRRPNSGLPHEGSFFGKEVHVFSDATVLHLPLDWDFLCPAGDKDGDGVFDCWDECPGNDQKSLAGVCGCLEPDVDADGDGVPECGGSIDQCDGPASYRGQCGCSGESEGAAPAGTPCNDGIAAGVFECDGNGTCGNPDDVAPEACCKLRTLGQRAYWICDGCDGGGAEATQDEAVARCAAVPGRSLVRIDDRVENQLLAGLITFFGAGPTRIGGLDGDGDGSWSWANAAGSEAVQFWSGGADGRRHRGMYEAWGTGQPADEAGRCSVLLPNGTWTVDDCSTPRSYICESTRGAARDPGGEVRPDPDPAVILDPISSTCINPPPTSSDRNQAYAEADACRDACEAEDADDAACRDACDDSAYTPPPPAGETCDGTGSALERPSTFYPGGCSASSPSCDFYDNEYPFAAPFSCVTNTECLDRRSTTLAGWITLQCTTDNSCPLGRCNMDKGPRPGVGFCTNEDLLDVCDAATTDPDGSCHGYCYTTLGCGSQGGNVGDGNTVTSDCSEVEFCADTYEDGFENDDLTLPSQFDPGVLDDAIDEPAPSFPDDFTDVAECGDSCQRCGDFPYGCSRSSRHPWCNYEIDKFGDDESSATDDRDGIRGKDSTALKVTFDPEATLKFDVKPLPLGIATFEATAAAAASSNVSFNFLGVTGSVELFELRAELSASLCRVHSTNSRAELLGIDFLPRLAEESGALFDTSNPEVETNFSAQDCLDTIDSYVDAVDRAKKALRDAQELATQYKTLLEHPDGPRTFADGFCEQVLGDGPRPKGMEGACDSESPADTVNAFIDYYHESLGDISFYQHLLGIKALDGEDLRRMLPLPGGLPAAANGYAYYVPFGDGIGDSEDTTIVSIQFFIGPIPCLLEVGAGADYGITGGFGIDVNPGNMINGGPLASAGAQVTPHISSNVSVFAGAGFNIGVFELSVGLEARLTLVSVDLPATARAGVKVDREEDPRGDSAIPVSLSSLSDGRLGFPYGGTRYRYNYSFFYDYGLDLVLSNILAGSVNARAKVKFVFFSLKYSQELLRFQGLDPITLNLIGGGSYDENTNAHEQQVVSEPQQPWKATYETVPFLRLADVPQPPADVVADAVVETDRVQEFLYDNLCQCIAPGQECNRTADCCTNGATNSRVTCFSDPALGGDSVCSDCRGTIYTDQSYLENVGITSQEYDSCNVDSDCCETGAVCSQTAVPTSCGYVQSGQFTFWTCNLTTPPTKVCQRPTPYVAPPDIR